MASQDLTHIDKDGTPGMVDVGNKSITERIARAQGRVYLPAEILDLLSNGDIQTKKGAVFQTAIIAGTMAVKKTGELIPFCHPLLLDNCKINIYLADNQEVAIDCEVKVHAKTGVEMEALTGVSVAALTIYDMCKAVSQNIVIKEIRLMAKSGGKTEFSRVSEE
ncbi:MAG: cyclic pyranopterin monophosphate synthase MoaC [Microscillaceae bacterium]|jgi:cyclic pyranopterin phosphate synthase|nr:cyclic pyranopterin monophosphate synthase MoaC [Microscillaceae bacterium]